jgi:hypothetical protein
VPSRGTSRKEGRAKERRGEEVEEGIAADAERYSELKTMAMEEDRVKQAVRLFCKNMAR